MLILATYSLPVRMDSIGRILIPAIVRNELGIAVGTDFVLVVEEGTLKILPKVLPSTEEVK